MFKWIKRFKENSAVLYTEPYKTKSEKAKEETERKSIGDFDYTAFRIAFVNELKTAKTFKEGTDIREKYNKILDEYGINDAYHPASPWCFLVYKTMTHDYDEYHQ